MTNTLKRTCLYSPSQIGEILKIARERSCQEERRTKRYVSEQLGITLQRLNNIEAGFSQAPFELAADWCRLVEDETALAKIKHAYQISLPATDPRLLQSVENQFTNLIEQSKQAITAAKILRKMGKDMRPGQSLTEQTNLEILKLAEEILDLKQAADATLTSMRMNWNLDTEEVTRSWILEAISDRVIIPSVSKFEEIRKEQFFSARQVGRA
ncbi:sporulation sigma factor-processing peptidase [Bacillus sp. REN10]|uniref:sporulation sigma factor-processing peptidase n=1 Tax=Bacillus sp. REN10 TaxID=2782541 RepID=UPI00193B1B4E|nr:sporulation sigma factor-processing peptidase [Bacillus sp. REN10]